jgi:nitroreductase
MVGIGRREEDGVELIEALYTTRAMRRVRPDPLPDQAVAAMMDAAIRAPSGGNNQNWRFMTISDPETRGALGPIYRRAWQELNATAYRGRLEQAERVGDEATLRVMRSANWLAEHFEEVPLWIMALNRNDPTGASIYPAVWSLMLAGRGLGIGTCLTTVLGIFEAPATFEALGIPADKGWILAAAVSAGYPTGKWGVATRRPAEEVVYADRWGQPVRWSTDALSRLPADG